MSSPFAKPVKSLANGQPLPAEAGRSSHHGGVFPRELRPDLCSTNTIGFRDTCPKCHAYLHCCVNCRLYSPSSHNHCLSPTTEYVRDVEGANFCEEFDFTARAKSSEAPPAKSKFDQLFGD